VHGPAGCGKSLLGNVIAKELNEKLGARNEKLTYFKIAAPQLVSSMSGESEANIRSLFNEAKVSRTHKN
jgi:ribosome biogenesis ATPase